MFFILLILSLLSSKILAVQEFICENTYLNIECPMQTVLQIDNAIYGRHNSTICPRKGVDQNTNCSSANATLILQQRCNGKDNCTFLVSNDIMTDPCFGTYKYLELNYSCEPIILDPPNNNCGGSNEDYRCADLCYREFCNSSPPSPTCRLMPLCEYRCLCRTEYLRDPETGRCINQQYCPLPGSQSDTHEVFSECGAGCQPTCKNRNPVCNRICIAGYVCANGYIRDSSTRQCIRPNQCPV